MDQKFKFVGTIGYGNSYLEFLFRRFKIFRLHAIPNDAAGAVRAHSGKVLSYRYKNGRGPKPCLLGHVTGQFFCLYVKLFLPFDFNCVDFCNSVSCIVLDNELADINDFKALGVFWQDSSGILASSRKKYKLTEQALWCARSLHGLVWDCGYMDYSELHKKVPRDVEGKHCAKGTETSRILA